MLKKNNTVKEKQHASLISLSNIKISATWGGLLLLRGKGSNILNADCLPSGLEYSEDTSA
jgi:hypothetical protein